MAKLNDAILSARRSRYQSGLCDQAIALAEGVSRRTITNWRRCEDLPINRQVRSSPVADLVARELLYHQGLCDREIAREQGVANHAIRTWRRKFGLPINRPRNWIVADARLAERMQLYISGLSDAEIAVAQGLAKRSVYDWRVKEGLSANKVRWTIQANPDRAAVRMQLYRSGLSDVAIAHQQGVTVVSVRKWRSAKGLSRHCAEGKRPRAHIASENERAAALLRRINRALGAGLPKDIREDAAANMYIDLSLGILQPAEIELQARKYGNRVLEKFASKFGPRSLDEELGDDGFTLLDTLVDDSSSSWLEEMGATAW